MTDHLVSPDRDIKIGELSLTLNGSFATLRAIQQAFGKDLLFVQASVLDMRVDQIAQLVSIASGQHEDLVGQAIIDEYDIAGADYRCLKAELLAWLAVAMAPKRDRKKKLEKMQEIIDGLNASPGQSTSSSA